MKWYSLFFLFCLVSTVSANAEQSYNRVSFTVSSETNIQNDKLIATVFASERGDNTQQLAEKVNTAIEWGVAIAKKVTAVEVATLNYSTNPEYKDGKVIAWRVKQAIRLESSDSKVLSDLLGELQQKLNIGSIQYQVSSALRKQTEETLIAKAMEKFKQRASQIIQNMGRKSYRVVRLNVSNSFADSPPYPVAMVQRSYAASAVPAPSVEAGKQKIVVNIQAEIELSEEASEGQL